MLPVSPFPYSLRALAIVLLASLQFSVNHGASDLPHLFGFFGTVTFISFTTPALIASYNISDSTAAARSALLMVVFCANVRNFSVNSVLLVHYSHVYADLA